MESRRRILGRSVAAVASSNRGSSPRTIRTASGASIPKVTRPPKIRLTTRVMPSPMTTFSPIFRLRTNIARSFPMSLGHVSAFHLGEVENLAVFVGGHLLQGRCQGLHVHAKGLRQPTQVSAIK